MHPNFADHAEMWVRKQHRSCNTSVVLQFGMPKGELNCVGRLEQAFATCLHFLRSLESHAANDGGFRLFSEDGGFAFLGLFETVDLADSCIVFDSGKGIVGQRNRTSLDILEQVLGDRLVWIVQDFDGNNRSARVLDAKSAE